MSVTTNKLVADLGSLPPIPHIASQVLRLTSDPDCSVPELQRTISSDQALTAQILKIANSAAFGMMRDVRTLSQAIMTLGLNAVKSVVIASSAKDLFIRGSATYYQMAIWEHSLVSALTGRALAKIFRFSGFDEVFLGGLLHDIGKTVMYLKFPDRYIKIIKSVHDGGIPETMQAELDSFGFDHTMVGQALLDSWNLPANLSQCVRWHHSPLNAEADYRPMAAFVALGNSFALEMGKGIGDCRHLEASRTDALGLLGISEETLAAQKEVVLDYLELDKVLIMGF